MRLDARVASHGAANARGQNTKDVMNRPLRGIDVRTGLGGTGQGGPALMSQAAPPMATRGEDATLMAGSMVGGSAAMLEVLDQIRRFAACDLPVLITGESGTGKELVVRAIHERSRRAARPNVAVNCAALPAALIASELFGYEKGAFPGAAARRHGHIERSQGGTLFLDEIVDMPLGLQGYLLRFLQEGEIVRVGGRTPIKVDARVITATNVPLRAAIAAGRLREDLFYHLNVLTLHLPPLRERAGDAELLAVHLLRKIERELRHDPRDFAPAAMAAIRAHAWPGNICEMIATLRRAVILANGPRIEVSDLRIEPAPDGGSAASDARPVAPRARMFRAGSCIRPEPGSAAERAMILRVLEANRHNMTRAAQAIGVSRVTLYRMLRRTRIELPPHARLQMAAPDAAG